MLYRYFKERYSPICHMFIERYSIRRTIFEKMVN